MEFITTFWLRTAACCSWKRPGDETDEDHQKVRCDKCPVWQRSSTTKVWQDEDPVYRTCGALVTRAFQQSLWVSYNGISKIVAVVLFSCLGTRACWQCWIQNLSGIVPPGGPFTWQMIWSIVNVKIFIRAALRFNSNMRNITCMD